MRYLAMASDYDGTLAHDGVVDDQTIRAIERLIHSGRKLILVTGRELPDLQSVFPRLDLCERVVAENGAVLYIPPLAKSAHWPTGRRRVSWTIFGRAASPVSALEKSLSPRGTLSRPR